MMMMILTACQHFPPLLHTSFMHTCGYGNNLARKLLIFLPFTSYLFIPLEFSINLSLITFFLDFKPNIKHVWHYKTPQSIVNSLRPLTSKIITIDYTYLNSLLLLTACSWLDKSWQRVHFKQEINSPVTVTWHPPMLEWTQSWKAAVKCLGWIFSKGMSMSSGSIKLQLTSHHVMPNEQNNLWHKYDLLLSAPWLTLSHIWTIMERRETCLR